MDHAPQPAESAAAPASADAWLKGQARAGRRAARPVVLAGLAGVLLAVGQAACAAGVLGAALTHTTPAGGMLLLLGGFALAAVLRAGLGIAAERAASVAGATARRRLRDDAFARLLAIGPRLLRGKHSAELAATAIDRVEAMDGYFGRYLAASLVALGGPALVAAAALWADPFAAAILVAAGIVVPVAMAVSGIGAGVATQRQFLAMSRLQTRFLDRVRGIATIVIFGRVDSEAAALAAAAADLRRRTMRVLRYAFISSAVLDCAMAAALVILALHYAARPAGTATTALFVLLLVPEFFAPLRGFTAVYQDRAHARTAARSFWDLPPMPPPAPSLPVRTVEARGVTVVFENVGLTWDAARGPALDGLSFRATAGETLVIAGPSGAGKSTIFEILLGFVPPDAGRVLINGVDLAQITPAALARLTAWIGQRPLLFAGTLRENIRFARPEATDAEIAEAAKRALVTGFSDALPQGLDTSLGESGYGLSGGQAQRVAIARAFLRNAPLLLLDEPTSHLDPATEAEVLDSLKRLAIGRTVILASHATAAHEFGGRRIDIRDGSIVGIRGAA